MRLNDATRPGVIRRDPSRSREAGAFWLGIAIMVAFELVLMAKTWSPQSSERMIGFFDRGSSEAVSDGDTSSSDD